MAGLDGVSGELMKYACPPAPASGDEADLLSLVNRDAYCCLVRDILNGYFEDGTAEAYIGAGHLLALQKPGKPKGPGKSLRPITVLNTLRKILSTIALRRAEAAGVNNYVPQSQHAFRKGKSTSEVVFAHRILSNVVENAEDWTYRSLSIDMSAAFDTPTREGLLNAMREATRGDPDVGRMTQMLLCDTTLRMDIGDASCDAFPSTIGTPQGDSFSPVMFTVYAEYVFRQIRHMYGPAPVGDVLSCIPTEMTYADDTDILTTDEAHVQHIEAILAQELPKHQLMMNAQKTEWSHIRREDKGEARGEWRKRKILGNKLGCVEDLAYRTAQGGVAFRSLFPILINSNARLRDRVRLYDCYVGSVVLYNVGCLGLSKTNWRRLNSTQTRHLRRMAGVHWPNKMTNDALYALSRVTKWSLTAALRRWRLLGHVLRLDPSSPARKALIFASTAKRWERRRGRPTRGLWTQLIEDHFVHYGGTRGITRERIDRLALMAKDKKKWLVECEAIARSFQTDLDKVKQRPKLPPSII
jgi:hypothetical protein